jgi:tetratricopeptide (TPR) repeat protein
MSEAPEPVGTLDVAVKHAVKLLARQPELAAEQATEILHGAPQHPLATLVLGVARRKLGDLPGALAALEPLAAAQPAWAPAHYELGVTLGDAGRGEAAVAALQRAVNIKSDIGDAWRLLGDHFTAMGDTSGADLAYANHIKVSTRDPRLLAPAAALSENRIPEAEALLRAHLKQFPSDIAAIRMLAEVAARLGRHGDAETLLRRCLDLAPGFDAARSNLAVVLHQQNRPAAALAELERLMQADPRNPSHRNLKAAVLARIGEHDQSIDLYAGILAEYPLQSKVWMSYGHGLKTAGRQPESITAYRRSIELRPPLGEAYWSLANLKTFRFSPQDVAAMRTQLARTDLTTDDRLHFHFALGKALEDAGEYAESFEHYASGNRLRRRASRYDAEETSANVARSKALFTPAFFATRAGWGCQSPDPIFIVGLPRSGSTLLEQILASHSAVEGTMELPDVVAIVRALGGRKSWAEASRYPEVLADLDAGRIQELGEQYLDRTRIQRKAGTPFFIDKLPNNWAHVGLIHLMLPNAKIIDARRHPLACCWSGFKQHFARGQNFTYRLQDIGRYYRDYVELMAHFDRVLPGRVHRVIHEALVDDTEAEVRKVLDYCNIPFEAACLRFYESDRAVRTASSEQVRRPVNREGFDQWRHFEPWLGPLQAALGPVLNTYPAVPDFAGR